jgi:hypothetical protein
LDFCCGIKRKNLEVEKTVWKSPRRNLLDTGRAAVRVIADHSVFNLLPSSEQLYKSIY